MASKKRRSSLSDTPVKSPKLKKETKGPSAKSKKRNVLTTKSKQCLTPSKNKSSLPTKKAIKKLQSSQAEGGRKKKNGNVEVTKKCNSKNVPAKKKALPKDVATSRRSTTKKSQPSSVRKTAARATSVQSKSHKIVKSQTAKRTKNEKTLRKPEINSVQAKKEAKKSDKNVQTKEKKPSMTTPGKSKLAASNPKRTAPSIQASAKNRKSDCKKDSGRTTETAKKLPNVQRTKQRPSTTLRQKTVDEKKPRSAQTNVTKKSKSRSVEKEGKAEMDSNDVVQTKTRDPNQSGPRGTSSVASQSTRREKISMKSTTTASSLPSKRKRDDKPEVKSANKVKRQKVHKPGSDKNNQEVPTEKDENSKRISILDLCNEIAGEIESDTVEVVKEAPSTSEIPTERGGSPMEASPPPPSEQSPTKQSKRFFPSRKPLQIKCRIEQKTSLLTKKSKWNKIKLKKNFAQNNILRSHAVLPNLESIKVKAADQQMTREALNAPMTLKKKPDVTSTTDIKQKEPILSERVKSKPVQLVAGGSTKTSVENGLLENHVIHELEMALDEGFRLHLDSSPENSPMKKPQVSPLPVTKPSEKQSNDCKQQTDQMAASAERGDSVRSNLSAEKSNYLPTAVDLQKEIRKLKEADKNSSSQPIIDAGQKRFGVITCSVCGMLYTASNPEDETQHLLFHNQFISAVKYVGWKKERIVAEYPDGKIIMVLPDDPKYALKKVEEIREMVDNDLGFQQVPLRLHSRTKTLLFISSDKKVVGCLIAEHIQWVNIHDERCCPHLHLPVTFLIYIKRMASPKGLSSVLSLVTD